MKDGAELSVVETERESYINLGEEARQWAISLEQGSFGQMPCYIAGLRQFDEAGLNGEA